MKNSTVKSVIAVLFLVVMLLIINKVEDKNVLFLIALIPIVIIIFNFIVRKIAFFKPYFLSPFNILSAKTVVTKSFDFSKDILVNKFNEVLTVANFKVIELDEKEGELFACSATSWKSWGENIYISIEETGKVTFISVAVGQIYTWGKNQDNLEKLVETFESSLTI